MTFEFRYERVLKHREKLEERALLNVAEIQMKRDAEQRALDGLFEEVSELKLGVMRLKGRETKIDELRRLKDRARALEDDIAGQKQALDEWEERLKDARRLLREARKEAEALRRLKEKELKRFMENMERVQRRELDEAALRPFTRAHSRQHLR